MNFIEKNAFQIFILFTTISAVFIVGTVIQFLKEPVFTLAVLYSILSFVVNLGLAISVKVGKFQD